MTSVRGSRRICEMNSVSPLRRAYYSYLSRTYALMYALSRRSVLGVRLIILVRWVPILALAWGWVRGWPILTMGLLLTVILWINYSLWQAKRNNYNRFVPDGNAIPESFEATPIAPNQKVAIQASGLFSVSGRENVLLLRPADYWRVPLGEHIIMVEEAPGKFLYQFFSSRSLQTVQSGWLLFGRHPIETLAVSFLARWGPEYTRFGQVYEDGNEANLPPPKRVTIYLSTTNPEARKAVWQTIVSEARRARQDAA